MSNTDIVLSSDTSLSLSDISDVSDNGKKRDRMSPRTKAFDEAIALARSYMSAWSEEQGNDLSLEVAAAFESYVAKLEEVKAAGPTPPNFKGNNYVGVREDGSKEHFRAVRAPKSGDGNGFERVYGPYKTQAICNYVMSNGMKESERLF